MLMSNVQLSYIYGAVVANPIERQPRESYSYPTNPETTHQANA